MPIFDYVCRVCDYLDRDVLVRPGHAVAVDCLTCGEPLVRLIGVPQPAIFTRGGTGAGRGASA